MKIDPRVDANLKSLRALEALLKDVISDPSAYSNHADLMAALRSQGALSKLALVEHGIASSSLNTMKRLAAKFLPGGFRAVDSWRLAAMDALENHQKCVTNSKKVTKALLQSRIDECDRRLQLALQDAWLLTMALEKSLSQGRRYASRCGDASVLALCDKEQREIREMVSLRSGESRSLRERGNGTS